MRIEKRDIETFTKKECQFREGKIYLDGFEVNLFLENGKLAFSCPMLTPILKVYLTKNKHIVSTQDTFYFSHPLIQFHQLMIDEDGIEMTFK